MELIHALRLDQASSPPRVAFVGAGGKTTAIFQCARQLAGNVLVTATTHLALEQLDLADQHYSVDGDLFAELEVGLPRGITLLTGPAEAGSNRTLGVSASQVKRIHSLAETHQIPLLIEADGSRQLPIKAPADHEPPIPPFVDLVVVVAGLSALGKPLTSDWVHRSEIFTALSGLKSGQPITSKAMSYVLTHSDGGLKNIPPHARRVVLLNQADTSELQSQAARITSSLMQNYDAVLIASLIPQSPIRNHRSEIHAVHQSIAAVILAAGEARRFGSPKQLLDWHGKPLVWHVAQKAFQAGLNPVLVVCGAQVETINQALADLPVELIHNSDWQDGQGSSVKLGTQAVRARCGGILFLLADQPQISVRLMRALIVAHTRSLNPITGPIIDDQQATPVLFDQVTFDDLAALSGDVGGRQLFSRYPVDWIPWHETSVLFDVDTPEDYIRLLGMDVK